MKSKICSKCNIERDTSFFRLRKDTGKYRNECRLCLNARDLEYAKNNKDKIRNIKNKYRNSNQGKNNISIRTKIRREAGLTWDKKNPEKKKKLDRDNYYKKSHIIKASDGYFKNTAISNLSRDLKIDRQLIKHLPKIIELKLLEYKTNKLIKQHGKK